MNRALAKKLAWVGFACAWIGGAFASCSAGNAPTGGGFGAKEGSGTHAQGAGVGTNVGGGGGGTGSSGGASGQGGIQFGGDSGPDCSTCESLGANCGPVTDPKCGGVIQCGTCPAGQTCGGGGEHSQCGSGDSDGCSPQSCSDQNVNCGQAGDGCGNTLDCGSCAAPQTCGGAKPNECGCTGVCSMVPTCTGGATTTLTGKVLDPAGIHPLYNALVYIPNDPNDPGLQPFPAGITCDVCGATAAGNPLVSVNTAVDGTFTLNNVPVGGSIKLVVQLGRWRRQFSINVANPCAPNTITDGTLTMPKNSGEGDIPRVAVVTGSWDAVECDLRKLGLSDTEFSDPSGSGRVHLYLADDSDAPHSHPTVYGSGATIGAGTPQSALFGQTSGQPTINQYDLVILECEGYEQDQSKADQTALRTYAESGGRVFGSHYAYAWFDTNGNFSSVANWTPDVDSDLSKTAVIDQSSNPNGAVFQQWLEEVGASTPGSGTVSLDPVSRDSRSIVAPTQQWLYWNSGSSHIPVHFTWNTPVGAASASQCGRVVFSDWHAELRGDPPSEGGPPALTHGITFPHECDDAKMTHQEAILEFMLFDLTSCVQPYMPLCTPTTCSAEGIECGPAGDGCGNPLDCGPCPMGQTCGGGGSGKCGTSTTCTPNTCAAQHIECGQAGDGCGNTLSCGNCPTGEVCGLGGPGKCGSIH